MMAYSKAFCKELLDRQDGYIADCQMLSLEDWKKRKFSHKFKENVLRLVSPVL